MRCICRIGLALALTVLVACAPLHVREAAPPTAEALGAQDSREAALRGQTRWTLEARIAISGENGGSGDLLWRQDDAAYTFSVRAVNGKTLRLSGAQGRAVLEGVDAQPDIGIDPETLLRDRLGAEVPFAALRAWARGLRAPGSLAQIHFDENNLPTQIYQDGWTVQYLEWFTDRTPVLPKKVFASKGKDKVKLIIQNWNLTAAPH